MKSGYQRHSLCLSDVFDTDVACRHFASCPWLAGYSRVSGSPRRALVFGASGQIGQRVCANLLREGWQIDAVSRSEQADAPGLRWVKGDLQQVNGLPARVDGVFSCGPLDGFAQWHAACAHIAPRIVAFGSTSVEVKRDSADAAERDIASRLRSAEALLFATAAAHGTQATVLRPTLIYGAGRDMTLTRIVALARRSGFFVLPKSATGGRQPVHVQDLADAVLAVVDVPATHGKAYALPGGETLTYTQMVERVLHSLQPPARLVPVPSPIFSGVLSVARALGKMQGMGDAVVARMQQDLVFDLEPARRDFGYAPRAFKPTADMFS